MKTGGGKRAAISGFSRSSRTAMMRFLNSIDRRAYAGLQSWFVGLTFPGQVEWCSLCPRVAKRRYLRAFLHRHQRAFGRVPVIWKLEPQKRGAPHFHLLILGQPASLRTDDYRAWIQRNWWEVVGSNDEKHRVSGYSAEKMRTWEGVTWYGAKYVAKVVDAPNWKSPGRFWGVENRDSLPITLVVEEVTNYVAVQVRRSLRRRAERQPSGRWKVVSDTGKVSRRWLEPKQVTYMLEKGWAAEVRPIFRRIRRERADSMKGLGAYMRDGEMQRLVRFWQAHARSICAPDRLADLPF